MISIRPHLCLINFYPLQVVEVGGGNVIDDIAVIMGHQWGRMSGKWDFIREGYNIFDVEFLPDNTVRFKVEHRRKYYMWIKGYITSGPW